MERLVNLTQKKKKKKILDSFASWLDKVGQINRKKKKRDSGEFCTMAWKGANTLTDIQLIHKAHDDGDSNFQITKNIFMILSASNLQVLYWSSWWF